VFSKDLFFQNLKSVAFLDFWILDFWIHESKIQKSILGIHGSWAKWFRSWAKYTQIFFYNDIVYNETMDITTNFYGRICCQLHANPIVSTVEPGCSDPGCKHSNVNSPGIVKSFWIPRGMLHVLNDFVCMETSAIVKKSLVFHVPLQIPYIRVPLYYGFNDASL
jgi:hypothetical protein